MTKHKWSSPVMSPSQLQQLLDEINNDPTPLPKHTFFGDLNPSVPRPYSKFINMDNPPTRIPNDGE